ncbi:hypothetical protein HWB19_gp064 [Cronobacter phage vB_CsaP_009]|uniref:Uncharacterized protein n=1 Tax=Cronobacter phage vB_CsaP_009 TaxID=2699738 RepID=A0A679FL88_9CAUD|nr:hypothetical protein HWB19_gp064 [Cronobacter phage vB_CsaP_009]BBU72710.1 hypothetical protein [Cronobacter phage vB_CsaP_009]
MKTIKESYEIDQLRDEIKSLKESKDALSKFEKSLRLRLENEMDSLRETIISYLKDEILHDVKLAKETLVTKQFSPALYYIERLEESLNKRLTC